MDSTRKRPRRESKGPNEIEVGPLSEEVSRHQELWFKDGNIVLTAGGTSFKVHAGILAHHSEILRDMFEIAQSETDRDMFEGCPRVQLSDTQQEIEVLISAMYNGGPTFFDSATPLPFSTVSVMLRMGTKYGYAVLRTESQKRLESCYSSSLGLFHKYRVPDIDRSVPSPRLPIIMTYGDMFEVIPLARTFDLVHLLPPVFYILAQLEYDVVSAAVESRVFSSTDLARLLTGAQRLRKADCLTFSLLLRRETGKGCTTIERCRSSYGEMLAHLLSKDTTLGSTDILRKWDARLEANADVFKVCQKCRIHLLQHRNTSRLTAWKSLGDYFGVPNWTGTE